MAGRLRRRGAQQHADPPLRFAAERHAMGVGKVGHQGSQVLLDAQRLGFGQPGRGHQVPGQFGLQQLDRRMLQLGLLRLRAIVAGHQRVDARQGCAGRGAARDELLAPVHGDEGLRRRHRVAAAHRQQDRAAARGHVHQRALAPAAARQFLWMNLDAGLGRLAEEATERAGAAHAVPLVAQAARGQRKRVARLARLGRRAKRRGGETRTAVGCGETAVLVQARAADRRACEKRPLLRRGLEPGVGQAGDVEVAPARALAVLVPQ